MATHSGILGWRIPWTEEPGGLQSIRLQRVRQNWSHLACMHYLEVEDWHYWYYSFCVIGWGIEKEDRKNYFEGSWCCLFSLTVYKSVWTEWQRKIIEKGQVILKTVRLFAFCYWKVEKVTSIIIPSLFLFLRFGLSHLKKTFCNITKIARYQDTQISCFFFFKSLHLLLRKLFLFLKE